MATTKIKVVTPTDLGSQFSFVDGRWRVATVAADAGNLVASGFDGGAYLDQGAIRGAQAYPSFTVADRQLTVDDGAGHITVVPLDVADIHVTGASLVGTVLHLRQDGEPDVELDLGAFLQAVATANSTSIALSGSGTAASPIAASVILDPVAGTNLLKVGASGIKVDPADILALLNANTAVSTTIDPVDGVFRTTVSGQEATTPIVELVDSAGVHVGYAFQ